MKLFDDDNVKFIYRIEMKANEQDKAMLDALIEQARSEGINDQDNFEQVIWERIPQETKQTFANSNGKEEAFHEYIVKAFIAGQSKESKPEEKSDEEISGEESEGLESDQGEIKENTANLTDSYFKVKLGNRELLGSIRAKDSAEAIDIILNKYEINNEDKIVAKRLTDEELVNQNEVNNFVNELQDYIADYNHNHDAKLHIHREFFREGGSNDGGEIANVDLGKEINNIREAINKDEAISSVISLHHDERDVSVKIYIAYRDEDKGVKEMANYSANDIRNLYGRERIPKDEEKKS